MELVTKQDVVVVLVDITTLGGSAGYGAGSGNNGTGGAGGGGASDASTGWYDKLNNIW